MPREVDKLERGGGEGVGSWRRFVLIGLKQLQLGLFDQYSGPE